MEHGSATAFSQSDKVCEDSVANTKRSLFTYTLQLKRPSFKVFVDTENERFNESLSAILYAHSRGIPLMISLLSSNKNVRNSKGVHSNVRGVFHCPKCLSFWEKEGELRTTCDEIAQLTQGPNVPMEVRDAILLADALQWSKKFVFKPLEMAYPKLQKARSNKEAIFFLKMRGGTNTTTKVTDLYLLFEHEKYRSHRKQDKNLAARMAQSFRRSLFSITATNNKTQLQSHTYHMIEDVMRKVSLIGMLSNDGSFFPGFFSKLTFSTAQFDLAVRSYDSFPKVVLSCEEGNEYISGLKLNSEATTDFNFSAQGKIDRDGSFNSTKSYDFLPDEYVFPSLRQVLHSQIHHGLCTNSANPLFPSNDDVSNVPVRSSANKCIKFIFSVQQGLELNVSGIFASGIWYFSDENEYFLAGLFDSQERFKAAYCCTRSGYLVPGATNKSRQFVPLSKYLDDGTITLTFRPEDLPQDQKNIIEQLLKLPEIPKASDIAGSKDLKWVLIRNGIIIDNPAYITMFPGGALYDDDSPNIYVGGKIGPDGQLFFYGSYNEDGYFFPGAPPLISDNLLGSIPKDERAATAASEKLFRKYGIRLLKTLKHKSTSGTNICTKPDKNSAPILVKKESEESTISTIHGNSSFTSSGISSRRLSREPSRVYNTKHEGLSRTPSIVYVHEESKENFPENELRRKSSTLRKPSNIVLSPISKFRKDSQEKTPSVNEKDIIGKQLKIPTKVNKSKEGEKRISVDKSEFLTTLQNTIYYAKPIEGEGDFMLNKIFAHSLSLHDPSKVSKTLVTNENLLGNKERRRPSRQMKQIKPPSKSSAVPDKGICDLSLPRNSPTLKKILPKLEGSAQTRNNFLNFSFGASPDEPVASIGVAPFLPPLKTHEVPRPKIRRASIRLKKNCKSKLKQPEKNLPQGELLFKESGSETKGSLLLILPKTNKTAKTIQNLSLPSSPRLVSTSATQSKKHIVLPDLKGPSNLRFTENFRFSYFNLPSYVKGYNKRINSLESSLSSAPSDESCADSMQENCSLKQSYSYNLTKK